MTPVKRSVAPALLLAGMLTLISASADAQWNPNERAALACEQTLTVQLAAEVRARDPLALLDSRSLRFRQARNQVTVTGGGDFRRDRFDRGRAFTFDCTVDTRSGAARASFRWGGGNWGSAPDPDFAPPPAYRPPPSGGWGGSGGTSYPSTGRVFFSGGIVNRASGRGLDVQDRSSRDAANVQQWDFGRNPNQLWDVVDHGNGTFSILSQGSGKALDVANQSSADGANVQQYRFHNGDNQLWRLERVDGGFYQIVSLSSGRCLDVESIRLNENGANVQQWSCSGAANQQWRLTR